MTSRATTRYGTPPTTPPSVPPPVCALRVALAPPFDRQLITNYPCLQVAQIKEKVEEKEGIPPVQQRLIYGGKQMYV